MKFRMKITIIIGIVLAISVISFIYLTFSAPSTSQRTQNVILEIPKHAGLKDIAFKLESAGVIKSHNLFILSVLLRGDKNKLKAGEYEFKPGDSLNLIIEKLVMGDVIVRKITIPEGYTINEIAVLLERDGVMSKEAFLEKAHSGELAKELLGDRFTSFEGYLFPDSYSYKKGIAPEELIRIMVSKFKEIYKPLRAKSGELDLTDREIVTLASIIEKETGNASERPLVSAVFYNRLILGMRLESDPTVIYGMSSFDGNLRKKDLTIETEYNTYVIFGFPPGPISNPGKGSLESALNPAHVNYPYFVSRGDGTHEFSSNYTDHRRAVTEYQKGLSSNGKKPQ